MTVTTRMVEPLIASALVALAAALATWWLVGDLSETTSGSLSYAVAPPSISPDWARAVGMSSVAALGLVGALVFHRSVSGAWDSRWPLVLILIATAGTAVGYGGRVLTAGVAGANQGAGVMVLLGGPVVVGLLATAAVTSYRIIRH